MTGEREAEQAFMMLMLVAQHGEPREAAIAKQAIVVATKGEVMILPPHILARVNNLLDRLDRGDTVWLGEVEAMQRAIKVGEQSVRLGLYTVQGGRRFASVSRAQLTLVAKPKPKPLSMSRRSTIGSPPRVCRGRSVRDSASALVGLRAGSLMQAAFPRSAQTTRSNGSALISARP
jgi:hypothetical protein